MVMAHSLFIRLKQNHPDSEIDVVAPAWSVPLLKRMPQVHQAIELPVGHNKLGLLTRYKIGKSLRARHYDQSIVTPRSLKSALVPFFSGAKKRTGYLGEMQEISSDVIAECMREIHMLESPAVQHAENGSVAEQDAMPANTSKAKKSNNLLRNTVFTLLVVALLGGAFYLYYYKGLLPGIISASTKIKIGTLQMR